MAAQKILFAILLPVLTAAEVYFVDGSVIGIVSPACSRVDISTNSDPPRPLATKKLLSAILLPVLAAPYVYFVDGSVIGIVIPACRRVDISTNSDRLGLLKKYFPPYYFRF